MEKMKMLIFMTGIFTERDNKSDYIYENIPVQFGEIPIWPMGHGILSPGDKREDIDK